MSTPSRAATPHAAVSRSFDRVAGAAAFLTAVTALGYAVAFIVLRHPLLAGVCLLVEGVSATAVWTAVYHQLRLTDPGSPDGRCCSRSPVRWAPRSGP